MLVMRCPAPAAAAPDAPAAAAAIRRSVHSCAPATKSTSSCRPPWSISRYPFAFAAFTAAACTAGSCDSLTPRPAPPGAADPAPAAVAVLIDSAVPLELLPATLGKLLLLAAAGGKFRTDRSPAAFGARRACTNSSKPCRRLRCCVVSSSCSRWGMPSKGPMVPA